MTSKNIILVHAMSRTGQHPVIDWIYNQFVDNRLFFNYMYIQGKSPFFENRSQYYFNDKKYFHILNPNWEKYGVVDEKMKEFIQETSELVDTVNTCDKNLLMMNFENVNLEDDRTQITVFNCQFSQAENFKNVLIVRDIFNYLASKIKMGRYFYPEENLRCWKIHAREYLGKTDYLSNKVTINFNRWTTDTEYKQEKSKELGCDLFLPEWNQVSSFGGGSSFDHMSFQNNGNKMSVLERWKDFKDNEQYRDFLKDKELIELSEAIFGYIQGTEIFTQ